MTLDDFFEEHPQVALAFSGGVDSSYLLYAAKQAGARVKAYYVKTAFQPEFEYQDALRLAKELGADMEVMHLDALSSPQVAANPQNRCYYCKQNIFGAILKQAHSDGFDTVLDGTNASDRVSDRPGMKALQEMKVLSPLRLCGLTKTEIRRLSQEAGLFTWDKPSYACLATRIPTGVPIRLEDLERTEWAEDYLMQLGFRDFRVRLLEDCAKVQLVGSQMDTFLALRREITQKLLTRYSAVLLDMEARDGR